MVKNKKSEKELKVFGSTVIGIVFIVVMINFVSAATLYWVGVNNGNWSDSSNWASTSGGAGGAGIPNSTNGVVFDSANTNNKYKFIIHDNLIQKKSKPLPSEIKNF